MSSHKSPEGKRRYHDYIYDFEGRRIVGDFEGAYANETEVWPSQFEFDRAKYRLITAWLGSIEPNSRILDVGCGYGAFVAHLRERGFAAEGVEISRSAVDKGRARFPDTPLCVGDITRGLDLPDE